MRIFFTLLCLLPIILSAQDIIKINGYIKEKDNNTPLADVNIQILNQNATYKSKSNGYFSIDLPPSDSIHISFSHVAYSIYKVSLNAQRDTTINIYLDSYKQLRDVDIWGSQEQASESQSVLMSKISIPVLQIQSLPSFFGENDAIKILQLMPGVQSGSEGQTGLYVRGGGPDQNLVMLDDAVVYNANHLFGFFSIFNTDILKSVELTKGGFPARFGGRLSSVLEMKLKEGQTDKLHTEGSISLIASRLSIEAPIIKNKVSLLVSGRRSYIDLLAGPFLKTKEEDSDIKPGYYFYDINTKISIDLNKNNKIYLSSYLGKDRLYANQKEGADQNNFGLNWGNKTASIKWNHIFNQKLFSNTSLIYSNFDFNINSFVEDNLNSEEDNSAYSLKYNSHIQDLSTKVDFDYFANNTHTFKFGFQGTFHTFSPSAIAVAGPLLITPFKRTNKKQKSFEGSIYAENTWQISSRIKSNIGLRLSTFQVGNKWYIRPEPRFSSSYHISPDLSLKLSFAEMNQYVHMLSNTGLGLPTDLWVPTTQNVLPQKSKQIAFGVAKDLHKPRLSITLEMYHKKMQNIISYKEGASFLSFNEENTEQVSWEDHVTSGSGQSYGTELLIHKKSGRFSGWFGYTLSWTKWKFPLLNHGKSFYPRYDRRNDLSIVGIYSISKNIKFSATWVYGTGNALTIPLSSYLGIADYNYTYRSITSSSKQLWRGGRINEYGEKNSFRAEPYHRLDISIQFNKQKRKYERTWEFGLYNLYNRKNPFFYDLNSIDTSGGQKKMVLNKYTLFPILPSVSYRFKF